MVPRSLVQIISAVSASAILELLKLQTYKLLCWGYIEGHDIPTDCLKNLPVGLKVTGGTNTQTGRGSRKIYLFPLGRK
jgi:hypothetical protein